METPTLTRMGTATVTGTMWSIDPEHSSIGFSIKHLKFATVHGRFNSFSGAIRFDVERPWDAAVELSIDTATIDTGIGKRDDHLRSADFFDVATFPAIAFRSTRVRPASPRGANRFSVTGDLTIHGVTREVDLAVELLGQQDDLVAFEAATTINRKDFGLNWNQALESGGVLVGDDVRIAIAIEANRTGR